VIMLAMMRKEELQINPPPLKSKGQIMEGVRYVLSTPLLRDTLLMMALVGTFTFEFQVSLPLIVQYTFKGDASSYAFLSAALGIGAVVGGLAIASQKKSTPSMLVGAGFLFGAAILGAAFMPTLALAGAALVFAGVCSIYYTSLGNSIVQLGSSPQMRGRVMSFWSIAFLGTTTIGAPAVGWFAEVVGPRWGLALGGIAALLAAALGFISFRRTHSTSLTTLPE
jgi:predicted MFS family arabinose efflux permease